MKHARPKYPMQHTSAFGADLYVIYTMEEWRIFYKQLMLEKMVAVDTETQGFDWFNTHRIVGMSFGWRDTHFYIPVRHVDSLTGGKQPVQLRMEDLVEDLKKFFNRSDVSLLLHNAKFDRHFFKREGIDFNCLVHDTRTIWHFYDENAPGKLKVMASGWRDMMGRYHKGLVSKDARDNEKEIDVWRDTEAKSRRQVFRDFIKAEADNLKHEMRYQGFTKTQIKAHLRHEVHANHENNAKKEDIHYGMVPCEIMGQYAGLDTYYTWVVYNKCISYIKDNAKLQKLYINELKLQNVLFDAEESGIHVDVEYLKNLGVSYDKRIVTMGKELRDLLWPYHRHLQQVAWIKSTQAIECDKKRARTVAKGFAVIPELNLNSTDQVAPAMLMAGVPLTQHTDSWNEKLHTADERLSLGSKVLKSLAHDPVVQKYQQYKKITKLKNTFVDGILKNVVNGLVYPSFNPNVKTGRMSVKNPNVQQMPRGEEIRAAFVVPSSDYYYLLIDYSQIEVRLTAHFSNDPVLIEAYMLQQDIHMRSGCEVFGYDYDKAMKVLGDPDHPEYAIVKFYRQVAKVVNFAIIYGAGPKGLSEQLPIPDEYKNRHPKEWILQCKRYIDAYLYKYVGVKRFVNKSSRFVRNNSYATNYFGRVRHLPHARATTLTRDPDTFWMEGSAQRQGTNFIVQGTAADVFKIAAVRIREILKGTKSRLVNFVHDEVQIYLHKEELHLVPLIKAAMEDFKFKVPLIADVTYSDTSWAKKKDWDLSEFDDTEWDHWLTEASLEYGDTL